MLPDERRPCLQPLKGVLHIAMPNCGSSDNERAVGNGFGHGLEFLSIGQHGGCAYGGASIFECNIVGIHHA